MQVKAYGSFTARICELEDTNRELSEELDRTRTHLNNSLGKSHTLHAEVSQLRHEFQTIVSQNSTLRGEIAQVRTGIAGAVEKLNMLQMVQRENEAKEIYGGQINVMNSSALTNRAKA